jgi:hypothetical protein
LRTIQAIRHGIRQSLAAPRLALVHNVFLVALEQHPLQVLNAPGRAVQAPLCESA